MFIDFEIVFFLKDLDTDGAWSMNMFAQVLAHTAGSGDDPALVGKPGGLESKPGSVTCQSLAQ